jgi:hypothetical protein
MRHTAAEMATVVIHPNTFRARQHLFSGHNGAALSLASAPIPRRDRTTYWTATVCAGLSLCVSGGFILGRPELHQSAAFLFGDDGVNLLVADRMLHGAHLYAQLAYPYGPIPIRLYAELSRLIGNTPSTYLWTLAAGSACSVWLASWLISRAVGARLTIATAIVALMPTMPIPGAFIGGYTSSIYYPFERVALLAVLVFWRPLAQRSLVRSGAIGALCGLGQGIRFGTMPVLFAAIVIVDMPALVRTRSRAAALRSIGCCLATFAAVEVFWIAWAFSSLPNGVARQFLWPTQLWETHQTSRLPRYPSWQGWRAAATQYLMPAIAFVLAAFAFARRAVRQWRAVDDDGSGGAAAVGTCFYVLGVLVFFRDEHHFRQFAWLLAVGAAPAILDVIPIAKAALGIMCAPALWPVVTGLLAHAPGDLVRITIPRGYQLLLAPAFAARIDFLAPFAHDGPVIIMPNGTGWLYGYNVAYATRHAWFYSPTVVRSFETETFLQDASRARFVIDCADGEITASAWPLPEQIRSRLQPEFMLFEAGGGCQVWKSRSTEKQ